MSEVGGGLTRELKARQPVANLGFKGLEGLGLWGSGDEGATLMV